MDEKLKNRLQHRWAMLEERCYQLTSMLDELDSIEEENEGVCVKTKAAYIVLQKELHLLNDEQKFIEQIQK